MVAPKMRSLHILISLNLCLTMLSCGSNKSARSTNSPQGLSSSRTTSDHDIDAALLAYRIIFAEIESDIADSKLTLEQYEQDQKNLVDVRADSQIIITTLAEMIKRGSNSDLGRYEQAIRYNERADLFLDKNLLPKPY